MLNAEISFSTLYFSAHSSFIILNLAIFRRETEALHLQYVSTLPWIAAFPCPLSDRLKGVEDIMLKCYFGEGESLKVSDIKCESTCNIYLLLCSGGKSTENLYW